MLIIFVLFDYHYWMTKSPNTSNVKNERSDELKETYDQAVFFDFLVFSIRSFVEEAWNCGAEARYENVDKQNQDIQIWSMNFCHWISKDFVELLGVFQSFIFEWLLNQCLQIFIIISCMVWCIQILRISLNLLNRLLNIIMANLWMWM